MFAMDEKILQLEQLVEQQAKQIKQLTTAIDSLQSISNRLVVFGSDLHKLYSELHVMFGFVVDRKPVRIPEAMKTKCEGSD